MMRNKKRPATKRTHRLWTGVMVAAMLCSALAHTAFSQTVSGSLDPGAGPTDGSSQVYTLEDIYNRLDTGAETQKQTTFTEPAAGPADGVGKTIDEIMAKAPVKNDTDGATPQDVMPGKTYWGLRSDGWGQKTGGCGAYVAPDVWKEFDCYNLAAIGKITGADPFTPSWELIGGYWQWGRKGPDPVDWYNTNTLNFAHGPTGPGSGEANSGSISNWDRLRAPDNAWADGSKTTNDPCPEGYRVPSIAQWQGVIGNNPVSSVGAWTINATNYSSAKFFGDNLMLPATGMRESSEALDYRGQSGNYWSNSEDGSFYASFLSFSQAYTWTQGWFRQAGLSVRCVAE
jgi:uncharacterized protein (TIGR02145 family)